jgi:hypothetical protein
VCLRLPQWQHPTTAGLLAVPILFTALWMAALDMISRNRSQAVSLLRGTKEINS